MPFAAPAGVPVRPKAHAFGFFGDQLHEQKEIGWGRAGGGNHAIDAGLSPTQTVLPTACSICSAKVQSATLTFGAANSPVIPKANPKAGYWAWCGTMLP